MKTGMTEKERTVSDEIASLRVDERRLSWEVRNPRACPRAACEAEVRLKAVREKISELKVLAEVESAE